jgi:hypothetical protein
MKSQPWVHLPTLSRIPRASLERLASSDGFHDRLFEAAAGRQVPFDFATSPLPLLSGAGNADQAECVLADAEVAVTGRSMGFSIQGCCG